jgi:hypothetical protein
VRLQEGFGVWGGMGEMERRSLVEARGRYSKAG